MRREAPSPSIFSTRLIYKSGDANEASTFRCNAIVQFQTTSLIDPDPQSGRSYTVSPKTRPLA
jgi:hypothetical protein